MNEETQRPKIPTDPGYYRVEVINKSQQYELARALFFPIVALVYFLIMSVVLLIQILMNLLMAFAEILSSGWAAAQKAYPSKRESWLARPLVEPAPGGGLRRFAQLVFSPKAYGTVFEPTLADLQLEYFEALAAKDRWRARFVLARGYWSFWLAVVAQLPVSLAKLVFELWRATKVG